MIVAGTLIEGRYRVDRLVGQGGFGSVYAGVQLAVDLPVAIKFLRIDPQLPADKRAEMLSHFVEEARILGRLRHDCVVRTIDQGILYDAALGATPYLVMEWGGDDTLRDLLESTRGRPLPLALAWPLFHGMVAGLAHAHSLAIAHRDLKPSNVMLTRTSDGRVTPRIIDFGIAKLFDRADEAGSGATRTRSASSAFTPNYAAPEQIASARTGPWTDVHALALLFVEMLTGRSPYGDDGSEGLAAIDPVRPTPARFAVDVGPFEPVLGRALALRPAERYPDGGAFLAALNMAATSFGLGEVEAASVAFPENLGPPPSRTAPPHASQMSTGASFSHTVMRDNRSALHGVTAPAPPASSSRRVLLAAGALGASAAIGFGVLAGFGIIGRKTPTRPREPEEEPEDASATPRTSAAPGKPTLIGLTVEELEARVAKAGLSVQFRNVIQNPRQLILTVEREGTLGAVHLIDMLLPSPSLNRAELEATLLPYAGTIVRSYRDTTYPGIAYAFAERTLLLFAWKIDPRVVAWFDVLVAGLDVSVRGNTITGPDPAAKVAPPRAEEPGASRLSELTPNELRNRLLKAGAEAVETSDDGRFSLRYGPPGQTPRAAQVKLFVVAPTAPVGALARHLAALASAKKPHTFAKDGEAAVVCEGSAGFDCMAFMKLVLEKLPFELKSLP